MGYSVEQALEASMRRKEEERERRQKEVDSAVAKRISEITSVVNEDYINQFNADSSKFFSQSKTDLDSMSWNSATNKKSKDSRRKTWNDISNRLGVLRAYARSNRDQMGEEGYNQFMANLDSVEKSGNGILDGFNDAYNYYSQWATEEEYNADAKRWQDYYDKWGHYADAEDFDEYKTKGTQVSNPTWDDTKAPLDIFGWKPFGDGADVSNMVTFAEANKGKATTQSAQAVRGGVSTDEETKLVNAINMYMKPEEKDIYNYLIGKGETAKANEYLESLKDTFAQREAGVYVEQIDDTALELVFSALAGLDSFASGVKNLANYITGAEADGTTSFQYAQSAMGSNNEGVWKVTNDLINTTGNMLPSILVGTITGGLGGALTMGASATGNAYAEMRNLGYDEWQARGYATLVGASEAGLSYFLGGISKLGGGSKGIFQTVANKLVPKFDKAIARVAIQLGGNMLDEGLEEVIQAVLEPAFKALMTGEDFEAPEWEEVFYSGLLGALSAGFLEGVPAVVETSAQSKQAMNIYGSDAQVLVTEALEIDPDNAHAQRMQARLDNGNKISGYQLDRLVQHNEATLTAQDMASIQSAAESRLTELGETGDVSAIAAALTKQAAGEKLSRSERQAISNSKYGQRVANELSPENIQSGDYSSAWAENLDTQRINPEEYSRLVEAAQLPQEGAEVAGGQIVTETPKAAPIAQAEPVASVEAPAETVLENRIVEQQPETGAANDRQMTSKLTGKESLQVAEESSATEEAETKTVTLEEASKQYGAQAQAMIHTYTAGQDVAKYDKAYKAAYDMGKSGVSLSYVMGSESVSYLTDAQKELAYEAGAAASDTAAKELDAKNKASANGKTGRKKGTVKGDGVTISDLKQTFNDTQGKAYKYLSTVAEVTGIDIVLYRSEAGPDGKFQDAQGRYSRNEPGTIYIDLNAGLTDIKSVDDLAKYAMLRTFSHEFTHFIEKWNPIQYNEFRKVVFDTLTERGENVHDLIEEKQARTPGMNYEKASREVVAEAMTDILPDANFVQELAENHKTIFQKLLNQLKEFVANLRDYFNSIGHNRSREANALKEQVGDTIKYLDSIVQLFDKVAVQAVEDYQQTVAIENYTDGGITNGTGRAIQSTQTLHRGRESSIPEMESGARAETGNRSGVSEAVGEEESPVREVRTGLENKPKVLGKDAFVDPPKGSALHNVQKGFEEYGVECHIVKASSWTRENPAYTYKGIVYISEQINVDTLSTAVPHETTHVMKQRGFKPYLEFIEKTPDTLNMQKDTARELITLAAEHRDVDIFALDDTKLKNLYDELNATVYGMSKGGILDNSGYEYGEWIHSAFYDFEGYIKELDGIHAQYKKQFGAVQTDAKSSYDPNDPYVRFAGLMGRRSRFEHGNFVYRILKVGPDNSMWQAHIDAADVSASGMYVANARGIHYTSELYENREDALTDIVKTARASKLLDEKPTETTKPKEEQALDSVAEDDVQYQNREYLEVGENYDERTDGENSQKDPSGLAGEQNTTRSGRSLSDAQSRERWKELGAEKQKQIVELLDLYAYGKDEADLLIGYPDGDDKRMEALEKMAQEFYVAMQGNRTLLDNDLRFRWLGDTYRYFLNDVEAIEAGTFTMEDDDWEQYQQRTNTLTDREVLAMAAKQVKVDDLTAAEKDALDIFQKRLSKLESLQIERAEQGRLYKEQQFGAKVDKAKAAETLNRMHVLDSQIQKASAEVLTVEEKTVLKRVLQKARVVVEQQERQHGQEILKRWRDRRNIADAIKKQRAVVEKAAKSLMDMLAHPTKEAHVPLALQAPLQKFLEAIDFSSQTQLYGKGTTIRDIAYTRALEEVRAAIAGQRSAMDGADDGTFELDIPSSFLEEIDAHIRKINSATEGLDLSSNRVYEMSSAELEDLGYMLKFINKAIRNIDKLHMEGAKARVSELAKSTMEEMKRRKPAKSESGSKAMWANYTPWYAFQRMGTSAQQVFKGLMQGQGKLARTVDAAIRFAGETYTDEEVKAWEKETHTVKLESGESVTMTTAQMMGFYCLSKREHALGHFMGGGIRISTLKKNGKELVQRTHYKLTAQDISQINSLLTARQKTVAEALQAYMQNVGGRLINEISMARWDYMAATENNYYPIKTDESNRDAKDPGQDRTNLWALLNKSFTKELTPNADNAVVVESIFDVFADHMSQTAEYNAFALPLVDAMKWFNYRQRVKPDSIGNNGKQSMSREFGKNNSIAKTEDGTNGGRKEETRETFYRRAYEKKYTVRERGKIACGYAPVTDQTGRAGRTEKALQEFGIPVIVHEGLEVNVDGITRVIQGDATSVAGDAVYVRSYMETDPVETAGHEAFHFWKHTDARIAYRETVIDNIDFSSDQFVQFQKDIAKKYFGEEVGIETENSDKFAEEILAYISGLVHAGDSNNTVRSFLRDYDAVKAAWDTLVERQKSNAEIKTSREATATSSTTATVDTHIEDIGVQRSIRDTLGTAAVKYFTDLMTDINSSQKAGRHENLAGKILSRSKVAAVGWNLRVAIQQPTAILRASLFLDMPSLMKGTIRIGTKELVAEMQKYSGIALWKSMGYYDLNVSRSVQDQIKGDNSLPDKANQAGMWLPGKMDEITWARIWAATKAKISKEQKLTGEDLLKATAELFEEIVYQTQVADSVLTRSSLMRTKTQFMKEATAFMAEPTVSLNLLMSAFQDYQEGHTTWDKAKRGLKIGFYGYALSSIVNALVISLVDAWRDDDEYEEFYEKYLQALFGENFWDGNLFSELNPLEKIVFVRDAISMLKGYSVAPGYADLFQSAIDLFDNFRKFAEGRGTITEYGLIYQSLQVLGNVVGFGASGIAREAVSIWNNTFGRLYPDMLIHRYEGDEKTEIRNAFNGGYLTAEEAKEQLLRQGLVDTEDEAYWTIQGWKTGDGYSRYDAIYDAVRNGGDFNGALRELTSHGYTEKDVLSQVKSKIGEWYKGGEITKQQAISMLGKYIGMDGEDITETVNKWSCKVVTGIAFEDIKDAFMDGEISQGDAKNMYITYGGLTEEKANEKVAVLAFVKKYPNLDDITYAAIEKYQTYCEAAGVPAKTFYDAWKYESNTGADVNAKGESISGSKKVKVLAYINCLDLTYAQKDSLYYAFGWAEGKISEAPWH